MDWTHFILALLVIVVVVPTWLRLHYRNRKSTGEALNDAERRELEDLRRRAAGLEQRLDALERILDAEQPGWRERPASDGKGS